MSLGRVHLDTFRAAFNGCCLNNQSQVFCSLNLQLALVNIQLQASSLNPAQNSFDMLFMLLKALVKNQNVIHIGCQKDI